MADRRVKQKGEQAPREAADPERERGVSGEAGRAARAGKPPGVEREREASDAREDEGWSQPESSAQKDPEHRQR
ncbi:conserved hypothetical protein [Anaeromyxobacter dehalogenans 2CP-1]|uniref:Uncharacterized protein n=1 Tax=Anaeromyxobacter dehalogenans (strain ATCC BAA-258 / DSM 21875 / 2CP-1) TaxID=455488 RepID=B8JEE9_ANAD2|nr:hypothetical protein [Anaeromyxobacter dehalogenans]ACL64275.1 conserved hypothetical protein [Anaeromyxobacter dehalogenans 2CP-1]